MPSDEAVRQSGQPTLIRTPDQLQQARRPDAPAPAEVIRQEEREAPPRNQGILGQLEAERAHD